MKRVARFVADNEIWVAPFLLPLVLFTPGEEWYALAAAILLLLVWLVRFVAYGRFTLRTPVDWSMGVFVLMIPVTLWATAFPDLTYQSVGYMVAGVLGFYMVVNWTHGERRLLLMMWALVAIGVMLALVAPLGMQWPAKMFQPPAFLPHLQGRIGETINGNVLGGAVLLPITVALSLVIAPGGGRFRMLRRILAAVAALIMLGMLVLAQSRGTYVALAGALTVLLALRWPVFWVLVPVGAGGALYLWRQGRLLPLLEVLLKSEKIGDLNGRLEVWSRAWYAMQDFSFTGVGMGAFGPVVNLLYPFFLLGPDAHVPHAHNLFLQLGVDLGFPGLIAYMALLLNLSYAAWSTWQVLRRRGDPRAWWAWGLVGSMLALVFHGLVDAVTWGTKPALLAWLMWGVVVALRRESLEVGG